MQIPTIRMQILTIWPRLNTLESKFYNHSKGIRHIRIQILTIRMQIRILRLRFEAFKCIIYSSHWNVILAIRMQIGTKLEAFECNFYPFQKKFRSITMQIWTLWTSNSMQSLTIWKGFAAFECKFEPFETESKHLNNNSKHSKGIQSIPMQILTLQTRFEAFECKF